MQKGVGSFRGGIGHVFELLENGEDLDEKKFELEYVWIVLTGGCKGIGDLYDKFDAIASRETLRSGVGGDHMCTVESAVALETGRRTAGDAG